MIEREIRGLHEAAYLLAAFTFLGQLLALLRDRAFAHAFGAGAILDAYFAAFRIPDVVFAALTLFVSSFALVPLLSGKSREEQGALLGPVLLAFGIAAAVVSAVLYAAVPVLVPLLTPGFDAAARDHVIMLSRIMLLQPLLLGLSSIAASFMQATRRFVLFALAPIMYNSGIIMGVVFLYPTWGIAGLGWGVVLGALLHLAVQTAPFFNTAQRVPLSFGTTWTALRSVIVPSIPRSAALFANQGLLLVFVSLASAVSVGAVSALTFGFNLQSVPLTVIGVSYAAALFPALSSAARALDWESFRRELWASVRHVAFWLLPATVLFIVLRAQIVRVVLGSGAFSWDDTRLTAAVLALFAVSILPQALLLLFSRAAYARGATAFPVVLNVGSAVLAALLAYLLIGFIQMHPISMYFIESLLRVESIPGTAVLLIPLAYTITISVAALIFAMHAARDGGAEGTGQSLGVSFSASILCGAAAYAALQALGPLLPTDTFLGIFAQGAGAGLAGIAAWVAVLWLMRSRELADIATLILHKLRRN